MRQDSRSRGVRLSVETLEGRALLSVAPGLKLTASPPMLAVAGGIKTDPAGVAAVLKALSGGAGSEFVTLIRREVPNLQAVIAGFVSGRITSFTAPGIAAKIPKFQSAYTGGPTYDNLSATLAGAVVLPGNVLELAAVMRGPFDEASPCQVVFGLDRGAGAKRGPIFAARPKITPDALVTINVGPYGRNPTATVTDLTTGKTTAIDPSKVQVTGPVARVYVDLSALPSEGQPVAKYRFATWTRAQPGGGIANVGSFVPESTMVQVGVLNPPKR